MPGPLAADSELYADWDDELLTGEAVALDLRPAGFVLRAAGTIIDFLVYAGGGIGLIASMTALLVQIEADEAIAGIAGIVVLVLALVVAPTVVETASRGKSLGRLALGTRIVRDDGGAIGFRHALIRALSGILELFFTMGGLAAIVGLLGRRTKRLGDLMAGTYSQYERVAGVPPQVFGMPTPLETWAQTADVARLPARLSRRIAQFLAQAPRMAPGTRAALARELAAEAAVFVSPIPAVEPELLLAGIAVLRREREAAALELERRGLERLEPALRGLPHGFPDRG
ncbi:RDD family protein [Homoserinibacter sp. YIM 151385]|uniref:RDD family protein n=1 Tax=Homoserinibacter sp. YIM 151385 TaxID=2985506 RepID=UPI0022F00947|nr:RDD family protein [Homoserinibacter sp. YIM 151385]WBU37801.1 RDD family protein [Homoserinibacter sp. YIM 151385]